MDIEKLLQHRPFVRRLARSLVRDEARADDLVQETYLTAMRRPPRHEGALRAWLAAVVRNLARTANRAEYRRTKHERKQPGEGGRAAPRELPTAEETLEKAAWHARLVEAVMGLDEPYRTTLLMRYFEELDSNQIARLQDVPAATVRTRVKRGLERLRARLDEVSPGGRARWMAALLLLARPPGEAAAATAAAARQPWKLPAPAVPVMLGAALLVVVGVWVAGRIGTDSGVTRGTGTRSATGIAPDTTSATPDDRLSAGASRPQPEFGNRVEVLVLDGGRPADGANVVLSRAPEHPWSAVPHGAWQREDKGVTDRDGRVRFAGLADGYLRLAAWRSGRARTLAYLYLPEPFEHALVIDLEPQTERAVTVIDAHSGEPVTGASVWVEEPDGGPREPGPERAVVASDGNARLLGLDAHDASLLSILAPGYQPARVRLPIDGVALEPLRRVVRWPLPGGGPIADESVLVVRPDGADALHARVARGALVSTPLSGSAWPEHWAFFEDGRFARLEADQGVTEGEPVALVEPVRLAI
ncbi:MAG: sigma-70 family RNA polymerase sigma factor, partial [Planctomycetota bacterium]